MTMVETAKALAGELAAQVAEGNELRRLPDATWKLLVDSGLTRMLQPRRWGGGEVPLVEFVDAVIEVSRANSSAGWVLGVMGVHPWQLALFEDKAQAEMWGADPTRNHSSSYMPTGKATKVEGGYRLSGRWSFSSGCDHGVGVNLGAFAGFIDLGEAKIPDLRSFLLHQGQYAIEDNWHTAGMRGTGSKDIVVDDAFVPDHRVQSHLDYMGWAPLPGQELNTGSLYKLSWSMVFNFVLAAAFFGTARGFLDSWTKITSERVVPPGQAQRNDPLAQTKLAEAEWTYDAAVSKLRRACVEMQALAEAGGHPTDAELARVRWDANHGADLVGRHVNDLYHAASGRTAFTDHPLHTPYQDVQTMLGHAYLVPDNHARNYGGDLLGAGYQVLAV